MAMVEKVRGPVAMVEKVRGPVAMVEKVRGPLCILWFLGSTYLHFHHHKSDNMAEQIFIFSPLSFD